MIKQVIKIAITAMIAILNVILILLQGMKKALEEHFTLQELCPAI